MKLENQQIIGGIIPKKPLLGHFQTPIYLINFTKEVILQCKVHDHRIDVDVG